MHIGAAEAPLCNLDVRDVRLPVLPRARVASSPASRRQLGVLRRELILIHRFGAMSKKPLFWRHVTGANLLAADGGGFYQPLLVFPQ
jgi:hypothetical protein